MAKRRYLNECSVCGCPLDPGEGHICEECLEAKRQQRSIFMATQDSTSRKDHRHKDLAVAYA